MKGWIEVTEKNGERRLINLNFIIQIAEHYNGGSELFYKNLEESILIKEPYYELKQLIEEAQK